MQLPAELCNLPICYVAGIHQAHSKIRIGLASIFLADETRRRSALRFFWQWQHLLRARTEHQ